MSGVAGHEPSVHVAVTDVCVGSTMCATVAPGLFEVVDGRSRPLETPTPLGEALEEAAESCPVSAIEVRDTGSGELLLP